MILLDVLQIHVRDEVLQGAIIDPARLDAIGKLGGDQYATTRELFAMQRPRLK